MRLKWSPCCLVLAVLLLTCFVVYLVGFINFSAKVKRFDNLKPGAKEIEIYLTLGEPSRTVLTSAEDIKAFRGIELPEKDIKTKKFEMLVYDGTIYLRKDLFLFVDIETGELVHKMKKVEYVIGDVVYEKFFGW